MPSATHIPPTIHNSLRRVRALLGAVYDDLATAGVAHPETHVIAELAASVEDMQRLIATTLAPRNDD